MDPDVLPLDAAEARVLGCLVEKSMTTPDSYPLSLNGVRVACNQVSNRDPVVDYDETTVAQTLRRLADRGLAKFVHRPGDRVVKYIHDAGGVLELSDDRLALLAVLMLRGAQTPGELRQRTARYVEFDGLAAVELALEELRRTNPPFVVELPRAPGQKESRWTHVLTDDGSSVATGGPLDGSARDAGDEVPPPVDSPGAAAPSGPEAGDGDLASLRDELVELRSRFDRLLELLGVDEL
jgi:uncharacterized protein YceH (UPF0502 family)